MTVIPMLALRVVVSTCLGGLMTVALCVVRANQLERQLMKVIGDVMVVIDD